MEFLNAIIVLLNYTIIPALTYGSQLSTWCNFCDINLWNFKICKFCNWRHDVFWNHVCNFAYMVFSIFRVSLGVLPTALLTIPFAGIMMIFYMLIIDKTVFKYYRNKKSPPVQFAMVSVGVMFVTQAMVRIIIGPTWIEDFLMEKNLF